MAIKHLISPGIGFSPGSPEFIITRGLAAAAAPVVPVPVIIAEAEILGGWKPIEWEKLFETLRKEPRHYRHTARLKFRFRLTVEGYFKQGPLLHHRHETRLRLPMSMRATHASHSHLQFLRQQDERFLEEMEILELI